MGDSERSASSHESGASKLLNATQYQRFPHVLRNTSAMIVLQAKQDIRKVSLWVGYSNLATTEVHVRADPAEKLKATLPPNLGRGNSALQTTVGAF